jgi:hypothetical protein
MLTGGKFTRNAGCDDFDDSLAVAAASSRRTRFVAESFQLAEIS